MLFVIRFTDDQNKQSIREDNLESHLAWLAEHQAQILAAGSLRSNLDANPVGAFWVVEASTKQEVESLYQSDPFWLNGLRREVEVLHWSKAFPDRHALI